MKPHHPASSPTKAKPSTKAAPVARKARAAAAPAQALPDLGQHQDMVREAAYVHYEARGCVEGHEMEDWLKAESDIGRLSFDDPASNFGQAPTPALRGVNAGRARVSQAASATWGDETLTA